MIIIEPGMTLSHVRRSTLNPRTRDANHAQVYLSSLGNVNISFRANLQVSARIRVSIPDGYD